MFYQSQSNSVILFFADAENAGGNVDMCNLCKEYATLALQYLVEDKTQAQVIEQLHKACSQMHNMVDKVR